MTEISRSRRFEPGSLWENGYCEPNSKHPWQTKVGSSSGNSRAVAKLPAIEPLLGLLDDDFIVR